MKRRDSMAVRQGNRNVRTRSRRPEAEALEGRILLYSAVGQWTYSSRITYSFMPDGTNVAGMPSVLFQTLNAVAPTATWQNQIEQAATPWEANANLNLALVSDNGAPLGTNGNQQDDPRFGDIRIGAIPLPSGVLAETFLPPPSNGGTIAGDILFNSNVVFQIGGGLDLQTVAAHEFGHALGLGDISTDYNAEMYYQYDGPKTALSSDDIAGIQSLYGARQYDRFNNSGTHNSSVFATTNLTPYIDSNGQITLTGLDNTTAGQSENYSLVAPTGGTGQMVVTVQSTNLSSFAPELYVFNSSLRILAQVSAPTTYGATLTATVPVTAGQKYIIKVLSGGTYGRVGGYGLEVNFGTVWQAPVAPPSTVVPQQPDSGGGVSTNALIAGGGTTPASGAQWTVIGNAAGWAMGWQVAASTGMPIATSPTPPPTGDGHGRVFGTTSDANSADDAATPAPSDGTAGAVAAPEDPTLAGLITQAVDMALSAWDAESGFSWNTGSSQTLFETP